VVWSIAVDSDGIMRPLNRVKLHESAVQKIASHRTKNLVASIPSSAGGYIVIHSVAPDTCGTLVAFAKLDHQQAHKTIPIRCVFWSNDEIIVIYQDGTFYGATVTTDSQMSTKSKIKSVKLIKKFQILTNPLSVLLNPLANYADHYHSVYSISGVRALRRFEVPWETVAKEPIKPSSIHSNGHTAGIISIATSYADSKSKSCVVATGSINGAISFWQFKDEGAPILLTSMAVLAGPVCSLSFNNDATSLCASGVDGAVIFINLQGSVVDNSKQAHHRAEKESASIPFSAYNSLVRLDARDLDSRIKLDKGIELTALEKANKGDKDLAEQGFAMIKNERQSKLKIIKGRLEDMLFENDKVADIEKLDREEFVIDTVSRDQILQSNKVKSIQLRASIYDENSRMDVVCDKIKKDCWDSLEVQSKCILSFKSSVLVRNFAIPKTSSEMEETQKALFLLRSAELRETQTLTDGKSVWNDIEGICPSNIDWMVNAGILQATPDSQSSAGGEKEKSKKDEGENKDKGQKDGDDNKKEEEEEEAGDEEKEVESNSGDIKYINLFYHPLSIRTRRQKLTQIALLKRLVKDMSIAFNSKFDKLMIRKEEEMERIIQKNKRIEEILHEIKMADEGYFKPSWSNLERPEVVFQFKETEILFEKYIGEEEKKQLAIAAEIARKRAEELAQDNPTERALQEMMNGTLEKKQDTSLLTQVLLLNRLYLSYIILIIYCNHRVLLGNSKRGVDGLSTTRAVH
jgi:hypothetical protein